MSNSTPPGCTRLTNSLQEEHAEKHADQHVGCVACKESHHETSFCNCGRCFFKAPVIDNDEYGTFVTCQCGQTHLWD